MRMLNADTGEGSFYDGWSSFNSLKKREPGLVTTKGRGPMHCYLTPEVWPSPPQPFLLVTHTMGPIGVPASQ